MAGGGLGSTSMLMHCGGLDAGPHAGTVGSGQ